jgi:hypothetical protein
MTIQVGHITKTMLSLTDDNIEYPSFARGIILDTSHYALAQLVRWYLWTTIPFQCISAELMPLHSHMNVCVHNQDVTYPSTGQTQSCMGKLWFWNYAVHTLFPLVCRQYESSFAFLANYVLQVSHLYGLSPVCTRICLIRSPFWMKVFPHISHENGLSSEWIFICNTR